LLLEYVGKSFHGSQYQVGVRTVQCDLETALSAYLRQPVKTVFSGRTDSGVHSAGQVVHFDVEAEAVDLWRLCWGINGILKSDAAIVRAQVVPAAFHARYEAIARQYVYRILNRPQRSAILKDTHYFVPFALDIDSMRTAAHALLGRHDFAGFRSTNADKTSTICDVQACELLKLDEGRLEFWITANHFVYNMVRIIVGTLIQIGLGKEAPESLSKALECCDRKFAGPTAPPWGLTLNSVKYPETYNLFQTNSLLSCPGERS
jgi:tRNA pseudouridine38-40 synthase